MNKNEELAKNTAIITVGKICTQFMSFFLMPLYTSVLTPEEYGIVDLIITYSSLLMPVILFQVDQALFRFLIDVRNNNQEKEKIISTIFVFALMQAVITIIIFAFIQSLITTEYKWFLLFNILASICANMMLQTARGFGDNVSYAFGSFLSAFMQILGNVFLLIIINMGVYGMLYASIFSQLFTAILLFFRERIYAFISIKKVNKGILRKILQYSMPLIPNALCWWVLSASDRTIVLAFLGTSFNGLLSIGHKFSSAYITFYNIFNISWTESAALHINDSDQEIFFSGVITNMFKLFMCTAVGIIASLPFAFPVLINSKFQEAYKIIPIFMLSSMLNVVVGLYSVVYVALKKTKEIAKTSIYSGIINIVMHILLIKFIGLYAAAISTVFAFGLIAVYRYFDIKKYIQIRLEKKWIVLIVFMYIVTCFSYYTNRTLLQITVLLGVFIISFVINKSLILLGVKLIIKKIKK
ncbi:lipopolysaccharide biosynthesis protein [Enterocloster citroniae]|uniref:lipopolysaccharide biosynthesis protein n=1 Tax=Enterocloster citroniae TaxID=358743 RepID=UPI001899FB2A|nr:polysaccharide biosynthesis C-terminal domain-containing protein [Enterocloster citroniae]